MAAIIALLTTLVAQLDKLAKHMSRPRQHIWIASALILPEAQWLILTRPAAG